MQNEHLFSLRAGEVTRRVRHGTLFVLCDESRSTYPYYPKSEHSLEVGNRVMFATDPTDTYIINITQQNPKAPKPETHNL